MELKDIISIISQLGALGILVLVLWQSPRMLKDWQKSRKEELDRWMEERNADREARSQTSATYKKIIEESNQATRMVVDKFLERITVEGTENRKSLALEFDHTRQTLAQELKYERESCEKRFEDILKKQDATKKELAIALADLLIATREQTAVVQQAHNGGGHV